jgi:hypothetical protein
METERIPEKYRELVHGILDCYDRIVISGNLFPLCFAQGATSYLYSRKMRIFEYTKFAEPLRDQIKTAIETLAQQNGVSIEFVTHKTGRKEDRIRQILDVRGDQPGIVHILSAMESCPTYKPWHDKGTGKTFLKLAKGKCLHYYIYFIDPELGLCYLRVPTWCPFRLQFYCNGHSWLAQQLKQHGIEFQCVDNAFVTLADFDRANELAAHLDIPALHAKLDELARRYCPVVETLHMTYKWSIMQAEFATDLVFKQPDDLRAFYPHLLETLIHAVKPADIATFLGRKLHGNYQGEMGNRLGNARCLGTRIKHTMGAVSIKLYDKFGLILRIEATVNDASFFKQYRQVNHRNGQNSKQWAPMRKSVYSLPVLREYLLAANHRYLAFIAAVDTPEVGVQRLHQVSETKTENQHRYKGFNLLAEDDACLLRLLLHGEFCVVGVTNKALRQFLTGKNPGQISRLLKRLRVHGLIKKVGKYHKYYLTCLGRHVATMALKLREMYIIPMLNYSPLPAA